MPELFVYKLFIWSARLVRVAHFFMQKNANKSKKCLLQILQYLHLIISHLHRNGSLHFSTTLYKLPRHCHFSLIFLQNLLNSTNHIHGICYFITTYNLCNFVELVAHRHGVLLFIFFFLLLGVPRHGRVGLCRGVRPYAVAPHRKTLFVHFAMLHHCNGQHRYARSLPIPNAETHLIAICLDLRPLCQVKSLLGNKETPRAR